MTTKQKQTAVQALSEIQSNLHAPKSQFNSFGKYAYRNCEDILQAVKPHLGESAIVVSDDIQVVGDRVYVKATATFYHSDERISNTAYAREPLMKKGMDEAQITGATSSYARKYALNGLLLIDDNKDADSMDNSQQSKPANKPANKPAQANQKPIVDFPAVANTLVQLMNESEFEAAHYWRSFNHESQQPFIYKCLDKDSQNNLKRISKEYPVQEADHNE